MESRSNSSLKYFCQYDRHLFEKWQLSSSWNEEELLDYGCAYVSFLQFQRHVDNFKWLLYMIGGIIGIASAILALWTFANREFDAVSFMYHRIINIIELPIMALMIEKAARDYVSPAWLYSYSWATFAAIFSGKIENVFPTCVNIITLFISFERAIACLAPTHFSTINRSSVVWIVVTSAFFISILFWLPSSFAHMTNYDNRTEPARYMPVSTAWTLTTEYRSYILIRHLLTSVGAMLMVLATVTAVIGLRRTAARSLRRYSNSHRTLLAIATNGPNSNGVWEYWYLLKQLSYLQLCETVPLIVLHILLIIADNIHWELKGGGAMAPSDFTYTLAIKNLALARTRQRMTACLVVSNVTAHCFHFYLYLIFCPKVRRGFIENCRRLFRRRRTSLCTVMRNGRHTSSNGSVDGQLQIIDQNQSIFLQQSIVFLNGRGQNANVNAHSNITFV